MSHTHNQSWCYPHGRKMGVQLKALLARNAVQHTTFEFSAFSSFLSTKVNGWPPTQAMASIAMASSLIARASNLKAMASNLCFYVNRKERSLQGSEEDCGRRVGDRGRSGEGWSCEVWENRSKP